MVTTFPDARLAGIEDAGLFSHDVELRENVHAPRVLGARSPLVSAITEFAPSSTPKEIAMTYTTTIACLVALALAGAVALAAVDPATKCEADKLKTTGVHANCRLKADAKARLKGLPPDYTRCEQSFEKKLAASELKAGPGVCPTAGDVDAIGDAVVAATSELAEQLAAPDPDCPAGYRERTPHEVVQDWLDAYAAGDADGLTCAYHPAAFVTDDQGVRVGRGEIVDGLLSLRSLFGDTTFQVSEDIPFRNGVRLLWSLDGGWVVIPDGTSTFVVERGLIRMQTMHGLIEFTGPPPE